MKVVSLLPSATEVVCALGLEDELVGVTHECDHPKGVERKPHLTASRISHESMSSAEIDHTVRTQLDGHGTIYDLDTDLLASLSPDLIITQELCDVCAVSYEIVSKAAKAYTADATVVSLEPTTIDDIFETIITVGKLTGKEVEARTVVGDLSERLSEIWQKLEFVARKPKVMMLEWLEPPFAPGHWVPEQVETAGGICVMGKAGDRSITTTYQAIRESEPDVMVLIPCGYREEDVIKQLAATKFPANWRSIPAIINGEVWTLDASSYFSRPGPRVVDGVEILAKILHPSIFGPPQEYEAIRIDTGLLQFEQ